MTDDKKHLVQEVIDRLLYCPNYEEALKQLNSKFDPHKQVKFKTMSDFKFPIEKAI